MSDHPLRRLAAIGQSVWLDDLGRGMLGPGGFLGRLIAEDGLSGVTSNPATVEKAVEGSSDYDDEIRRLSRGGKDTEGIYESLVLEDVGRAADLFRDRFEETGGEDGFVSIEVSPRLARDPLGSIAEARRLWEKLDRPNILIKIPGTTAGLLAIGQLLREGINVNITLLFSVERYREVQEIHQAALEERVRRKLRIDRVASVASFFLSRIDTALDPRIEDLLRKGKIGSEEAQGLLGKVALSNGTLAYRSYREAREQARWDELGRRGARPQRLLWASTRPKDPRFDDLYYVEPLVAPGTITTLTLPTLEAYRDHGRPAVRLGDPTVEETARRRLKAAEELGLSLESAFRGLEEEGVRRFVESYEKSLAAIRKKTGSAMSA